MFWNLSLLNLFEPCVLTAIGRSNGNAEKANTQVQIHGTCLRLRGLRGTSLPSPLQVQNEPSTEEEARAVCHWARGQKSIDRDQHGWKLRGKWETCNQPLDPQPLLSGQDHTILIFRGT
jgi:hypothetical protein